MIHDDQELAATQERSAYFYRLLAQLRVTASPRSSRQLRVVTAPRLRACRVRRLSI